MVFENTAFVKPVIFAEVSVIDHDSTFAACVVIVARRECEASPLATVHVGAVNDAVHEADVSSAPPVPSTEVKATEVADTAVNAAAALFEIVLASVPLPVAVIVTVSDVAEELSTRK